MINHLNVPLIEEITAEQTIDVRWPVLRAGLPRDSAVFPGDNDPATRHLGAFDASKRLMAVASIYRAQFPDQPHIPHCWQLRGMATVAAAQRRGFGSALVRACISAAMNAGGEILWCNARTPARQFYLRHGFTQTGAEFEIPTAGPHIRMWRKLRG
ncbi:MAG TPA: GNAT family N-acetyltransferase [Chthoniobacteraceae bacterium]|nr:GNAT family N-acetyltransferase [Chthoniobacteraceae bacterium]